MRKAQYYEPVQAVVTYTEDENSFFLTIYILMGYEMGQARNRRIKMLLVISLLLHAMSLVATIVNWKGGCLFFTNACFEAHDRPHAVKSFLYSFYRPTITGDRSRTYNSAPSSFIGVYLDVDAERRVLFRNRGGKRIPVPVYNVRSVHHISAGEPVPGKSKQ